MTWIIPLSTVKAGPVLTLGLDEDLYVAEGVILSSTSGFAVRLASEHRVIIDGILAGRNGGLMAWGANSSDIVFGANAQLVGLENSAVQLAGRNIEVTNNGDVLTYGSGRQVAAIAVGMPADATMETDTVVENMGSISAVDGWGMIVSAGTASSELQNHGDISGRWGAYRSIGNETVDVVINFGRIHGQVLLGGGNDVFIAAEGIVHGSVSGGAGDDLLQSFEGSGLVLSGFWGGSGNDSLEGSDGGDMLWGGRDNDTIQGGAGNDDLYGEHGDDILQGGDGSDILSGGAGKDVLSNGDGSALLLGGGGDDRLEGGDFSDGCSAVPGTIRSTVETTTTGWSAGQASILRPMLLPISGSAPASPTRPATGWVPRATPIGKSRG